jgi:hypothetical protein
MNKLFASTSVLALSVILAHADPVTVRRPQGYLHGFVVLKDLEGKVLAAGDVIQTPGAGRLTKVTTLHFGDGSLYQETVVFSQQRQYKVLTYKQVQKGPSFKTAETLTLNAATGKVNVRYTDKDGAAKSIDDTMTLPPDLANGLVPTLLQDLDPKAESTLSLLVSTPKPRLVKLKIAPPEQANYSLAGITAKANHYIVKFDLGTVTGAVAKVIGKQPPPVHMWLVAGDAPAFLKSEGPLFEDGPIWRIELASPTWAK